MDTQKLISSRAEANDHWRQMKKLQEKMETLYVQYGTFSQPEILALYRQMEEHGRQTLVCDLAYEQILLADP